MLVFCIGFAIEVHLSSRNVRSQQGRIGCGIKVSGWFFGCFSGQFDSSILPRIVYFVGAPASARWR